MNEIMDYPRFFTMCGYRVERRFGWDCHGVAAEFATEEELGLNPCCPPLPRCRRRGISGSSARTL